MLTSLTQVRDTIEKRACELESSMVPFSRELLNIHESAILFSGGLESHYVYNHLLHHQNKHTMKFRVSMLLDTREYGIILPAVIQARLSGYEEVIISDDFQGDVPFYSTRQSELLLTSAGRKAASEVLGINVIANEDWGLIFDKWSIVPDQMKFNRQPILSCFEQEYDYWENHNIKAHPCGNCKKCFHIHVLQLAKFGYTDTPCTEANWERYCTEALGGLLTKQYTYGLYVLHAVEQYNAWDKLLANLDTKRHSVLQAVRNEYTRMKEKHGEG